MKTGRELKSPFSSRILLSAINSDDDADDNVIFINPTVIT